MMKCTNCGGVYESLQADATRYFHACPPIELVTIDRLGAISEVPRDEVLVTDKELRSRFVLPPDGRDENVKITGTDAKGNPTTTVKAEGKGATDITAAK